MKTPRIFQSLLALLLLAPALSAATFTVNTLVDENGTGPDLSLRESITAASSGDTINFAPALSGGTIELTHGYLTIQNQSMTIDASMLPEGITVSGGGASKVFFIFQNNGSGTVNLNRIAVVKGFAGPGTTGGGIDASANFHNAATLAVNLLDCRIDDNHSEEGGGGISVGSEASLTLDRCSLVGNTAEGNGGAISTGGNITATNCTITCNRANGGAAIQIGSDRNVTLSHCTVTGNRGNSAAIDSFNSGSVVLTLNHTIVAANSSSNVDTFGVITSLGYNILGDPSPSYATSTDILTDDPKLLDPMVRGGFTKTCAFRPDSPACDAGDPTLSIPLTDQRGFARFRDGDSDFFGSATIDIGAYELGETVIVNTATDELFTFPDSGTSLREALVIAAGKGDGTRISISDTAGDPERTLGEFTPTSSVWIDGLRTVGNPRIGSSSTTTRSFEISGSHTVTFEKLGIIYGSSSEGGCLSVDPDSRVNLIDSFLALGTATRGGGIHSEGALDILRSRIYSCQGLESSSGAGNALGGAIFSTGRLHAENSIIDQNDCEGRTAGIRSSGETSLVHCTVVNNDAELGPDGAGLHQTGGHAELQFSVFAHNLISNVSVNFGGTIVSGARNAEDGSYLSGQDDLTSINPKLDLDLMPLPFESPLIDRAEADACPDLDYLGGPRVLKGSANTTPAAPAYADLGAIESHETFWVTTSQDQNSGETGDGLSLREAIALSNANDAFSGSAIAFDSDLCGSRIELKKAMGGALILTESVVIAGPADSSASIEISGAYNDPTQPVSLDHFPLFLLDGNASRATAVSLRFLTLSRGATFFAGGAISVGLFEVELNLRDSVIHHCRATDGGALSLTEPNSSAEIERCSFFANTADSNGGAIHHRDNFQPTAPELSINRCTFTQNQADNGGAVFATPGPTSGLVYIAGSTLTRNRATTDGGGIVLEGAGNVRRSIISGNEGGDVSVIGSTANILLDENILGNDPLSTPSNLVTSAPGLGEFGDHGGTTPTVELLAGSPAIDFPFSLDGPDQRELPTFDGNGNGTKLPDAGAYEFRRPTIFVTTAVDENGAPGDPETSLREAVALAGPGDVIQFDLALNGQTIMLNSKLEIASDDFVEIDASPLPAGVTISGGGTLENLVEVTGYAQFKGLVFTASTRTALQVLPGVGFPHARIFRCHFQACGDDSGPGPLPDFAGVVQTYGCGRVELADSSFTGNRGTRGGTILTDYGGIAQVTQCTFSGNISTEGGVIANFGRAAFDYCTFSDNQARSLPTASGNGQGQVAFCLVGGANFRACVFDEDAGDELLEPNPTANPDRFGSGGHNVARAAESSLNSPSDLTGSDPQLGPELTHRVVRYRVPGNFGPSTDAVTSLPDAPISDIRGVPRPLDGNGDFNSLPDAGAVEAPPLVLVDIPNDENDGIFVGSGTSLRDAVDYVNGTSFPVAPVIGFAPFLSGQQISVQNFFGGEILVSNGLAIDASNLPESPIIIGEGPSGGFRVFQFNAPGKTVELRCVNITGGDSNSEGGGIWVTNSTNATFKDCEIFENFASTHGGGVAATLGADISMDGCSLVSNRVGGFGGGLFASGANAQLVQCTFALNDSSSGGGAIADLLASDIDLRHCTLADNSADIGGGGIDLQYTARAGHTILARNQPVNFHDRGAASFISQGYNLDDGTNGRFNQSSDIADISDVEMGGIQFLGGRTRVMPLFLCSPAVDTGDPAAAGAPAFDQTGLTPRVLDGDYLGAAIIDRGASELDLLTIDPDLDSDEIPNEWEVQNGYNPKDGGDALLDDDGDGQSTLDEYVAGTLPGDSGSYLRIVNFADLTPDQTSFLVEWTSNDFIPDLVYDIYVSSDLVGWSLVATDLPAMPSSLTTMEIVPVSQTPVKPKYFFRVVARRAPPI